MTVLVGQEAEGTGTNLAVADGAVYGYLATAQATANTGTAHIKFAATNTAGEIRIAVYSYNAGTKLPETLLCEGHLSEHTAEKGLYAPITLESHELVNGEKYVVCFMPVGGNATVKQGSTVASWKSTTGGHTSFASGITWKAQEEKGPASIWVEPSSGQPIALNAAASTSSSAIAVNAPTKPPLEAAASTSGASAEVHTPTGIVPLNSAASESGGTLTVITPTTPIPLASAASESGGTMQLKHLATPKVRSVKGTTANNRHEVTPGAPEGLAVGDLLLIGAVSWKGTAEAANIETPAGWTRIGTEGNSTLSGKQRKSALFAKVYEGGALPTIKAETASTEMNMYAYAVVVEGNTFPEGVYLDTQSGWVLGAGGSTTAKMPATVPDAANTLAISFVSSPGEPGSPEAPWTSLGGGANQPGTNAFSKSFSEPGSTGEPTYTHTGASNDTLALTLTILPVGTHIRPNAGASASGASIGELRTPQAMPLAAGASVSGASAVVRFPGPISMELASAASVSGASAQVGARRPIPIDPVAHGSFAESEVEATVKIEAEPGASVSGGSIEINTRGAVKPLPAESLSGGSLDLHAKIAVPVQAAASESGTGLLIVEQRLYDPPQGTPPSGRVAVSRRGRIAP